MIVHLLLMPHYLGLIYLCLSEFDDIINSEMLEEETKL